MFMDWTCLPTIQATRVSLRWITESDIDSVYRIFSDSEVMRYWATPPIADRHAAVELLHQIQEDFRQERFMKWAIARQPDDLMIGTATLFNFNFDNGRAEIGYSLARDQWGNGYCNEALTALLNYAFDELNLRRIEADVDPRNGPSIRTLERLGFQQEGYLRERWHVNGEIQDSLFYGLLKREWESRRRQEQ